MEKDMEFSNSMLLHCIEELINRVKKLEKEIEMLNKKWFVEEEIKLLTQSG